MTYTPVKKKRTLTSARIAAQAVASKRMSEAWEAMQLRLEVRKLAKLATMQSRHCLSQNYFN